MSTNKENIKTGKEFINNKKKTFWTIVLAIALGLFVNILVSFFSDFNRTMETLQKAKIEQIIIPFVLYFINYFIDSFRVIFMAGRFGYKLKIRDAFYNSVLGMFAANLTPSASGGQPFQIIDLRSKGINSKVATNIIMSRFLEYMIFSTAFVLIFFYKIIGIIGSGLLGSKFLIIGLVASFAITIMIALVFFFPGSLYKFVHFVANIFKNSGRTLNKIKKFESWTNEFRETILFLWTKNFWAVLIDLAAGGIMIFLQAYSLLYVFNTFTPVQIDPFDFMLIFILLNLVAYYIPTPGSSGGIEGVYSLILSGIVGASSLVAAGLFLWRFATYYLHLLIGVIVIFIHNKRNSEIILND